LLTANKPRSERTPKLIFEYSNVGHKKYTPANQLKDIAKEMKRAKEDTAAIAYYIARDTPLFQLYRYPELSAFYFYIIKRDVLGSNEYLAKPFILADELKAPEVALATEIWQNFSRVSNVEIWGRDTLDSLLYVIGEIKKRALFPNEADIKVLFDKIEELVNTVKLEALQGYKAKHPTAHFALYQHTLFHLQNQSMVVLQSIKMVYIQHHVSNILMSSQQEIGNETEAYFKKIIKQSMSLSEPNNPLFNLFFTELQTRIDLGRTLVDKIHISGIAGELRRRNESEN
jgi:hypothetical protein